MATGDLNPRLSYQERKIYEMIEEEQVSGRLNDLRAQNGEQRIGGAHDGQDVYGDGPDWPLHILCDPACGIPIEGRPE